jgi:oligopeptide transport system substrate-binding protein
MVQGLIYRSCPRTNRLKVFSLFLAACMLFVGCQRVSEVEKATAAGILLMGNGPDPQALDPQVTTGVSEINIHMALFEGLTRAHPQSLEPVSGVAHRWEISEDGRVYRFYLRPEARWSDGSVLTAEDFAFSWQRMLHPDLAAPNAFMLYPLAGAEAFNRGKGSADDLGIRVVDEFVLEVELHRPVPYFLQLLMHPAWYPVQRSAIQRWGELYDRGNRWAENARHVGNGPFQLQNWRPGIRVETVANPHYWDRSKIELNGIHFISMEETSAEERAYRAGQLHTTTALPPNRVSWWKEHHPEQLQTDPYLGTYYILLNHRHPALSDPKVRRALSLAIDRRALVENLLGSGEQPATSFSPPTMPGYRPPATISTDHRLARQLLAEAGYPEGRGFPRLQYLYNTSENHRRIGEALQAMWHQHLGIEIELVNQEWRTYLDRRERGDYQVARAVWIGDYVDPHTFLSLWSTGAGRQWSGWENEEYRQLMEASESTTNVSERIPLLHSAESLLLEEQVMIPIYFYVTTYLKRPEVQGWHSNLLNWRSYPHIRLNP